MGFSQEWEVRYAENTHMSVWPWSDVVSLVHRYCKRLVSDRRGRVLEMGCGAGANIPFFLTMGMDYFAVEGSPTIVRQLQVRFPQLSNHIHCGDFTVDQPFDPTFDIVLDRASITSNNAASIKTALDIAYKALVPGGVFIGVDWYSLNHTDYSKGEPDVDPFTRCNYREGQFAELGSVHFSDENHLRELFSGFEILLLEEKLLRRLEPHDNHQFASWNIVARKSHVRM